MEDFLKRIVLAVAVIGHSMCQQSFYFRTLATRPFCESKLMEQDIGIRSVLDCARICTLKSPCVFVQFCKSGGECALYEEKANHSTVSVNCSNGNPPITVSIQPAMSGNSKTPSSCDVSQYLVTGPDGVVDNQLSETSYYETGLEATSARLNNTGEFGCWAPASQTAAEYVQVDFLTFRLITGIVLTSRAYRPTAELPQFVTTFKVRYSLDCANFNDVRDASCNTKIFDGPSYEEELVTRHLEHAVTARCIMINPLSFVGYPSLRFDVLGC